MQAGKRKRGKVSWEKGKRLKRYPHNLHIPESVSEPLVRVPFGVSAGYDRLEGGGGGGG